MKPKAEPEPEKKKITGLHLVDATLNTTVAIGESFVTATKVTAVTLTTPSAWIGMSGDQQKKPTAPSGDGGGLVLDEGCLDENDHIAGPEAVCCVHTI